MIEALALAFEQLAIVIAADWSTPERKIGCQTVYHRPTSPETVMASFVRFAYEDSVHPQWTPTGFMFGHWGF